MQAMDRRAAVSAAAPQPAYPDLLDLRFRALVSDADWRSLPPAVRRRFSKHLGRGASAVYVGRVDACRMSAAGWLLAQATRIVGSPLPTSRATGVASVVTVTEDPRGGGQIWTRLYARRSGFPQMIHSAKRFSGPTGLEEHVGCGLGMSLTVAVEGGAILFRSHRYFLDVAGRRLMLPRWLTPGDLVVTHAETEPGTFRFILDIRHPWLGTLIRQEAEFRDSLAVGDPLEVSVPT